MDPFFLPKTTLTNGIVVANFSSPHPFSFIDGTVLPACSPERAKILMLEAIETPSENPYNPFITDIELQWKLSLPVQHELINIFATRGNIDVLLVPLPVMTAMKAAGMKIHFARCIRMGDRITKASCIDKFCK